MAQQDSVTYERRTVAQWIEHAWDGKIALTDFQRSFVWDLGRATEYLKAILNGKPVGLYLILAIAEPPQFRARGFSGMDTPLGGVRELVLDGQQRLTALLRALHGESERRFFIEVADMMADPLAVEDVVWEPKSSRTGKTVKGLDVPATAYGRRLIPLDILRKTGPREGRLPPLATWCIEVGETVPGMAGDEARLLEERVLALADRCLFQRDLWCCLLPETTDAAEATDIFVATNTTPVKIRRFDVEVAKARGHHGADLRMAIQGAYDTSKMLPHYFSDDPEDYVPEIGEWLLKVACLHMDGPPKEGNYAGAIKYVVSDARQLERLFQDLEWALARAEDLGAATDKMLPSQPPLHVLAALREDVEGIGDPAALDWAMRLVRAYYWKCLFSGRHSAQANTRLYQDYKQLYAALKAPGKGLDEITAFDASENPLFDEAYLLRHTGWIGSSRLGKAVVVAVMSAAPPTEWMTNVSLTATRIRELQGLRKLDRHHVFPKAVLAGEVPDELIDHGLNGVVLDQRTNLRLWKIPPDEYVSKMCAELSLTGAELRPRFESHLVPYEQLKSGKGKVGVRYRRFLQARAKLLVKRVRELVALPH